MIVFNIFQAAVVVVISRSKAGTGLGDGPNFFREVDQRSFNQRGSYNLLEYLEGSSEWLLSLRLRVSQMVFILVINC